MRECILSESEAAMGCHGRSWAALALSAAVFACGDASHNANSPSGSMKTTAGVGPGGTSGSSGSGAMVNTGLDGGGIAPAGTGPCQLNQPAFCDAFETASPGGRAGDLDDSQWTLARISTDNNPSQGQLNEWPSATSEACGKMVTGVVPDNDIFFCSPGANGTGQMNNTYNDGSGFVLQSYRIRRPFDFAGRTGVIALDVSGKAQTPTGHGWWWNVFLADEPVPAPYQQGGAIALYVKHGVGFEFEGDVVQCHNNNNASLNSLSTIYIEDNYAITHSYYMTNVPCFQTNPDQFNHVELHVNQSSVSVFVSDANAPATLRLIASVTGLSLPFTRGYVSLQHTHYNAYKEEPNGASATGNPPYTTYHWDNVGFDGPVLPMPRAYEVPDTLLPSKPFPPAANGTVLFPNPVVNTGYQLGKSGMLAANGGSPVTATLTGVDLTNATDAVLTLNAWYFTSSDSLSYRFNGGTWRTFNHPFPTSDNGARAISIPVQMSDLQAGNNALEMTSASGNVVMANADLTINVSQ
jgi:hypothetical protein